MKEKIGWQSDYADRLPWMVEGADIEIIPFPSVLEKLNDFPEGSRIAMTSTRTNGVESNLKFIPLLTELGLTVIPHLAARSIHDINELKKISEVLEKNNVEEVFVIGGNSKKPIGKYADSITLLSDLLDMNYMIKTVNVAGYPEGHPKINNETLIASLKAKIEIAKRYGVEVHINSQACYDPKKILSWINSLQLQRIYTPISLGIPTPTDPIKLAKISREIGVGDSINFLTAVGIDSALNSMLYDPTELLESLGGQPEAESIYGLHLFTFNNLATTVEWQKSFKPVHN
jgi:methylenetetrahydrofolate reductase (NADPH)